MKEVLYIGDETYICQQNDYDLKHLMESGYPELKYRFLCSRDIGIDSLFTILNQIDVRTNGYFIFILVSKKSLCRQYRVVC